MNSNIFSHLPIVTQSILAAFAKLNLFEFLVTVRASPQVNPLHRLVFDTSHSLGNIVMINPQGQFEQDWRGHGVSHNYIHCALNSAIGREEAVKDILLSPNTALPVVTFGDQGHHDAKIGISAGSHHGYAVFAALMHMGATAVPISTTSPQAAEWFHQTYPPKQSWVLNLAISNQHRESLAAVLDLVRADTWVNGYSKVSPSRLFNPDAEQHNLWRNAEGQECTSAEVPLFDSVLALIHHILTKFCS